MNRIYDKHKHWIKVVKKFGETNYAEDIVQEAYLKLLGRDINEAYFYFTLRSMTMDLHRKKIEKVELTKDIEYLLADSKDDNLTEEMAKPYFDFIDTWEWYDKRIYLLYVNQNVSLRKLAKETKIGLTSLYITIRNCKNKIKQWQDQKNKQ